MGGISMQLWQKTPSGWKAVFEHASCLRPSRP
jgi:hypothetical protein